MADIQVLRVGKISSVNYTNGTARVTYEDRDSSTTAEIPFLAWEYWMPKVADQVIVGHLSNGSAAAVILGPIWNGANRPYAPGDGVYRKEMSNTKNKAVILYLDSSGTLKLRAGHIVFEAYDDKAELTVQQIQDDIDAMLSLQRIVSGIQDEVEGIKKQISSLQDKDSDLSDRITSLSNRVASLGG